MVDNGTISLKIVVEQYHQLMVDDYQRTYAWSKDELVDLFNDLQETAKESDPHFFGTLILQKHDGNKAKVVDGQQRLTSVFLLVASLRDELSRLTSQTLQAPGMLPVNVAQKVNDFLYPTQALAIHRFVPNRFLRQIFQESVMALPGNQIEVAKRGRTLTLNFRKAITNARQIVAKDLSAFDTEPGKLARINLLLDTLLLKFNVLCVPTSSLSESLDIFLTMNNRGTPLGPSDLVRGEVMGHLTDGETEEVQRQIFGNVFQQWDSIAENVKEPEVFLRHYLVSTTEDKIQKKKVLEIISAQIAGKTVEERKTKAHGFWNALVSDSEAYAKTINPPLTEDWGYYAYLLNGLLKSHRIALLRIIPSGYEAWQKTELIRLIMVLSYKSVMGYKNKQQLEDFFQSVCTDIRAAKDFEEIKNKIIQAADFDVDVLDYLTQEGDAGYVGKSILHALDRLTNPAAIFQDLNADVHLEHVAPQSKISHWDSELGISQDVKLDEYSALVAQIGNLTLLDRKLNMQASQKDFATKKSEYFLNSVFSLSKDLTSISKWDVREIETRTLWIVQMFNYFFNVEKPVTVPAKYSVWKAAHSR
jgi:hypothetical protein